MLSIAGHNFVRICFKFICQMDHLFKETLLSSPFGGKPLLFQISLKISIGFKSSERGGQSTECEYLRLLVIIPANYLIKKCKKLACRKLVKVKLIYQLLFHPNN